MPKREPLWVWLHGVRVAELRTTGPGVVLLNYTAEALDRWPANIPLLSCSLPLGTKKQEASAFFRGLLPEGQHLHAIAAEARVPSYDTFGLLARFGRDVAGAAVVARQDPDERPGDVVRYTADDLAAEVAALPERPLGLHDDSELSIAGLQDKLLLVELADGEWGRPVGGRPSTHILKVEDRRFAGMAELELGCLKLARELGLTSVDARCETVAGFSCLVVSRFDREVDSEGVLSRIHQEDACQALNVDVGVERGRGKYERSGGPEFRQIAELLDVHSADPLGELTRLVRAATFTVLVGNADAHGKNVGLVHPTPEHIELAPLYDTVPTVLLPGLRTSAAMTVNRMENLELISLDDFEAEAKQWKLDPGRARRAALEVAEQLIEAAACTPIPEDLRRRVTIRAERFVRH